MHHLTVEETLILQKGFTVPSYGIICAHPGRVRRIADEFLSNVTQHTDYRGFQVYTGYHRGTSIFVANTGIGAPAAAFLIEELRAFGARRILRLGSNDSSCTGLEIKAVAQTTFPIGLCRDYGVRREVSSRKSVQLLAAVTRLAAERDLPVTITNNEHLDGYYPRNFPAQKPLHPSRSRDMESGALYLLGEEYGLEHLSLLLSYPKHETGGEYQDGERTRKFESKAIELALELLVST